MTKIYLSAAALVLSILALLGNVLPLQFSMKHNEAVYIVVFICVVSPIFFVWGARIILKMVQNYICTEQKKYNNKENKDENE